MHCFAVRCATRPGECLAVTGSSPELGGWKRPGIKLMEQQGHRYRPGNKPCAAIGLHSDHSYSRLHFEPTSLHCKRPLSLHVSKPLKLQSVDFNVDPDPASQFNADPDSPPCLRVRQLSGFDSRHF